MKSKAHKKKRKFRFFKHFFSCLRTREPNFECDAIYSKKLRKKVKNGKFIQETRSKSAKLTKFPKHSAANHNLYVIYEKENSSFFDSTCKEELKGEQNFNSNEEQKVKNTTPRIENNETIQPEIKKLLPKFAKSNEEHLKEADKKFAAEKQRIVQNILIKYLECKHGINTNFSKESVKCKSSIKHLTSKSICTVEIEPTTSFNEVGNLKEVQDPQNKTSLIKTVGQLPIISECKVESEMSSCKIESKLCENNSENKIESTIHESKLEEKMCKSNRQSQIFEKKPESEIHECKTEPVIDQQASQISNNLEISTANIANIFNSKTKSESYISNKDRGRNRKSKLELIFFTPSSSKEQGNYSDASNDSIKYQICYQGTPVVTDFLDASGSIMDFNDLSSVFGLESIAESYSPLNMEWNLQMS